MTNEINPDAVNGFTRRKFLGYTCLTAASPLLASPLVAAQGNATVLPLDTPGLDHFDVVVPDVEATAKFYMALFNTKLHAQPFRGAQRYFILLGEMNERREVGYLAIGASNGRGTYIGHFCTSVVNWRQNSDAIWTEITRQVADAGLGDFPGATGFGGIFDDPGGIEIQFLPSPDTLVTAAVPSDLVEHNQGLVTPLGVDHVDLNVTDLDKALIFYRILYGNEESRSGDMAQFHFPNDTRINIREIPYSYDSAPGIASIGIKTRPYDWEKTSSLLTSLGATVQILRDPGPLEFTDPDGIRVQLNPV